MNRMITIAASLSLSVIICFWGCKRPLPASETQDELQDYMIDVQYARGFSIYDYGKYKLLKVYNPWQNLEGKSISYLLYNRLTGIPSDVNFDVAVPVPVRRVICMSTTHVAMIRALEETNSIAAVSGENYIYDSIVKQGIESGRIPDIGYEQSVNYELILRIKPDVVFMYGVTGDITAVTGKLESLNIPVALNAEYLENDPLARTEWIKFMSCFYNKLDRGIEFFKQQEEEYVRLKKMILSVREKPFVMTGLPWKNTWWVPGGRSFAAVLIRDAGGQYVWDHDTSRQALPLDIEAVYHQAGEADFWINSGSASTLGEFTDMDPRLSLFRPLKESRIYNNNARLSPEGGNDYWESGVIYPQVILKDLIHIFHPEVLPEHSLYYYRRLE